MRRSGRGRGRYGPPRRHAEIKDNPIKIKKEKLRELGHIVSPENKVSPTFSITEVIRILKDQESKTEYQDQELRAMLKTWRVYKNKPIDNILQMSSQSIILELKTIQNQLTHQENDFSIDEVIAILKNKNEKKIEAFDTEDLREMLRVWKKHNNEDLSQIKVMNHQELATALEDLKSLIHSGVGEEKEIDVLQLLDNEVNHIFDTVKKMNIRYTAL